MHRGTLTAAAILLALTAGPAPAQSSRPAADADPRDWPAAVRQVRSTLDESRALTDREHRRAEDVKAYNRQLAEDQERQEAAAGRRFASIWGFALAAIALTLGLWLRVVRASERRRAADAEAARARGERVIALLESIERRLPPPAGGA